MKAPFVCPEFPDRPIWYGNPYAIGFREEIAPMDVHAAAQALTADLHARGAHSLPPSYKPTLDFQHAYNHAFGPLGGLGTAARPELLKIDGIYGPRTELALSHVLVRP